MPDKPTKKFFVGPPVNESWQAYREYIYTVARQAGISTENDGMTEDDWKQAAARFWAGAKKEGNNGDDANAPAD